MRDNNGCEHMNADLFNASERQGIQAAMLLQPTVDAFDRRSLFIQLLPQIRPFGMCGPMSGIGINQRRGMKFRFNVMPNHIARIPSIGENILWRKSRKRIAGLSKQLNREQTIVSISCRDRCCHWNFIIGIAQQMHFVSIGRSLTPMSVFFSQPIPHQDQMVHQRTCSFSLRC